MTNVRRALTAGAGIVALLVGSMAVPASATTSFSAGDVVVYRIGDGVTALGSGLGAPVFMDEYSPAGTLVQTVALPTAASGANQPLVASGAATSEGMLTLSTNGQYLIATGYDATPGTANLTSSASATVHRTVARIDGTGAVDTTTALSDFADGNNPRSAVSTDGSQIWVAGATGGVRFTTLGSSTSTQLSTTLTNLRQVQVFGGQLYVSTSSGSAVRVGTVGSGLPTTSGQAIANLPGFLTAGSPYSFALVDLSPSVPGLDTLYVAEDTLNGGQIEKFSLLSGTWTAEGTLLATAVRGLTASVSGTNVTIYGTTGGNGATGGGALYKLVDASGAGATMTGTVATIVNAPNDEAFRGVAFAPVAPAAQVPETPLAIALPVGALLAMVGWLWRRRRQAIAG